MRVCCVTAPPPPLTRVLDHVGEAAKDLDDVGVRHGREHGHLERVLHRLALVLARVHDLIVMMTAMMMMVVLWL